MIDWIEIIKGAEEVEARRFKNQMGTLKIECLNLTLSMEELIADEYPIIGGVTYIIAQVSQTGNTTTIELVEQ